MDISSSQTLVGNNFSNNQYGIYLEPNSNSNTFYLNNISFNTVYGIFIDSISQPNNFYYNIIDTNQLQATQSNNNNWDNGNGEGNYWSDYTGLDNGAGGRTAGDGIGDTKIPHPGTTYDAYPFMNSSGWLFLNPPVLYDPGDLDKDGNFKVTWSTDKRTTGYILQEDNNESFNSPLELYYGTGSSCKVTKRGNGTYYYRVLGSNIATKSPWSNIVDMVVDWIPSAPKGLSVDNVSGHEVVLSWEPNSECDLGGYHVFMNNTGNGSEGPFHFIESVSNSTTETIIPNLIEETTYHFVIMAFDHIHSNSSFSNVVSATTLDVTAPDAPKGLVAEATSGSTIDLTWAANTEKDLMGYQIYMNDTGTGPAGLYHIINITINKKTSYTVDALVEETAYYFKLQAFDEVPNISPFSKLANATTPDTTPPVTPTGLKVINTTYDFIMLTWDPNPEKDVIGYRLFRYDSKVNTAKKFEPSGGLIKETQFKDTGLNDNTIYYYRLLALDDAELSSPLTEFVSGKTLERPRAPEINNSIKDVNIFEDSYDDMSINLLYMFKDQNKDILTFDVSGQERIKILIYQLNGTVVLRPEKDWCGVENVTFSASDGQFQISARVNITVIPVNDAPGPATIVDPSEDIEILEGDRINLSGQCSDPDLPYGDALTYSWHSNLKGKLGDGEEVSGVELPVGYHEISLIVTDDLGLQTSAKVIVQVTKRPVEKDNGKNDEEAIGSIQLMAIGAGIIIFMIVIVLAILLMTKRKKKIIERTKNKVMGDEPWPEEE
jgi:parallel beta-helix repeat protein